MMSSDRFHPPDLILVGECDAVHLIGAVLLQERSQAKHALPRTGDIGQHHDHEVLLAKPAGLLLCACRGRRIFHQRICPEDSLIGGDRLRRRHTDILLIYTACSPDALSLYRIGHRRIAHGVIRKLNGAVRQHRRIGPGLILWIHDNVFLGCIIPGSGIVIACDHCGAVIGSVLPYQYCCTSHVLFSSCLSLFFEPYDSFANFVRSLSRHSPHTQTGTTGLMKASFQRPPHLFANMAHYFAQKGGSTLQIRSVRPECSGASPVSTRSTNGNRSYATHSG